MLDAMQHYRVATIKGYGLTCGPQVLQTNRLYLSILCLLSSSFLLIHCKMISIQGNETGFSLFKGYVYGIRLSHIFEAPSFSNEKSGKFEIPSISIKNLGFQSKY